MYRLDFSDRAIDDMAKLKRSESKSYNKLRKLLEELMNHPTSGTGRPEQLGYGRGGQWSRRISQKHRLVYEIKDETVTVLVLSAYGHYNDK